MSNKEILLANPRGFCAGVERAIEIVERALLKYGPPVYVRHEIVHNKVVVRDLEEKGAIFVDDLAEVPPGSHVIFSAHGVSQAVRAEAESRGLKVFDATCPLVTKVHIEVARMREQLFTPGDAVPGWNRGGADPDAVLRAAGATAISVSQDEAERLRFWSGRKNAFPASGRISPDYMCMDSTIPRKRLADILLAIQEMEKKYQLRCANVFHAGDGNLHPLILFDANDPDQLRRCELFGADILETSVAMGGTVTGEHGVGLHKMGFLVDETGAGAVDMMRAIKRALDPKNILNPGKIFAL